ncbi:hypothetical protein [Sphingomonas sp.]|jgi:hypothetical protein|uniref:hypothetical protein n=1 Tax=Sphingomonas sp. TaxID=28214 RepID=UPI002E3422CD|nr:hypothetical protein [Sphingomonas sp.]
MVPVNAHPELGQRPGQATGTSEVAVLMSTAEQSSALKTAKADWAEKKRTDI